MHLGIMHRNIESADFAESIITLFRKLSTFRLNAPGPRLLFPIPSDSPTFGRFCSNVQRSSADAKFDTLLKGTSHPAGASASAVTGLEDPL